MYNSIQYFTEKVIPQIEKKREKFMENPAEFGSVVVELKELLNEFGCSILSEMLTDCKRKSIHSRTVYSACFCGKSMLVMLVDKIRITNPQVKLHYRHSGLTCYLLA